MSEEGVDYDAEARRQGWVPEDEWRGDKKPKEFLTAKEFVERGYEINGYLKKELGTMRQELDAMRTANREVTQFYEKSMQRQRKEAEQQIADLKAKRAEAIDQGDGQGYTRYDDEIQRLERENDHVSPAAEDKGMRPGAQEFMDQNPWYNSNRRLRAFADGLAGEVERDGYHDKAFFSELTRRVKEEFPEEFEAPSAPTVEGGKASESRSSPGSQTYEDLPPDAKAQCEKFIDTIPGFTKEKYLQNYDWEE